MFGRYITSERLSSPHHTNEPPTPQHVQNLYTSAYVFNLLPNNKKCLVGESDPSEGKLGRRRRHRECDRYGHHPHRVCGRHVHPHAGGPGAARCGSGAGGLGSRPSEGVHHTLRPGKKRGFVSRGWGRLSVIVGGGTTGDYIQERNLDETWNLLGKNLRCKFRAVCQEFGAISVANLDVKPSVVVKLEFFTCCWQGEAREIQVSYVRAFLLAARV